VSSGSRFVLSGRPGWAESGKPVAKGVLEAVGGVGRVGSEARTGAGPVVRLAPCGKKGRANSGSANREAEWKLTRVPVWLSHSSDNAACDPAGRDLKTVRMALGWRSVMGMPFSVVS